MYINTLIAESLEILETMTDEKRYALPKLNKSDLVMAENTMDDISNVEYSIQAESKKRKVLY